MLDLLATMPPGTAMPVAALVEAAAPFGIADNALRVAVTRMAADGRLVRDERGRYLLGERALPVGNRVRSWRELGRRTRPWRGAWLAVVPARVDRGAGRQREKALRLLGFSELTPTLWLRPDNLTARMPEVRTELIELGLPAADVVAGLHDLGDGNERRARGLWQVEALRRGYRRSLADLEASTARLGRLTPARAMAETFLLGGRVIRELVLDPLLPDEICAGEERRALIERLRDYDRAGRLVWAALMQRWDLPFRRTPVDARAGDEPGRAMVG